MAGTTTAADLALLLVVLGVLAVALLVVDGAARLRTGGRPTLPPEDRAPDGLGRLVPVGAQVDVEYRRGIAALDLFLRGRRP